MTTPDLSRLSAPGTRFSVRVTPKASRNRIVEDADGTLRVYVTTVPEGGRATAAVIKLLSKAIGVPKSDLVLIRGATDRVKLFQVGG